MNKTHARNKCKETTEIQKMIEKIQKMSKANAINEQQKFKN